MRSSNGRPTRTSGRLTEAFACGTAAVVTAIGSVKGADMRFTIGGQSVGPLTQRIRDRLVAIQRGDGARSPRLDRRARLIRARKGFRCPLPPSIRPRVCWGVAKW